MSFVPRLATIAMIFAFAAATFLAAFDDAEARRAGSFGGFGSRGTRTFQAPPITSTAPAPAAPIERSMTPRQQQPYGQTATQPLGAQRPGLFNGFGRSMIGGLIAGGLLGMLLGHGFGGGFGFLGMLLQIGLIVLLISFAMRYFANRGQQTRTAGASGFGGGSYNNMSPSENASFRIPAIGSGAAANANSRSQSRGSKPGDEIGLQQSDLDRFEQLLTEIQTAYGAEDYGTLRRLTTPEAMSYLAEELGENATNGLRNSVSGVKLLQGDIAEAWQEGDADYATLAMRYSSVDAMVDRTTGRVVQGDDGKPSESTEIWTFVRRSGADWKLAAIQGTEHRAA